MRILVISHTEHYTDNNGDIVGWGPTIRELDHLAEAFGEVVHIACYHNNIPAPRSAVAYKSGKVRFIPIKPYGGDGFFKKLSIITTMFSNIRKIRKELITADIFQFRSPTSIGLYLIPYFTFFSQKKGWYKYAGNWQQKKAPLSYRIQRWMLLHTQARKITINGKWGNQLTKCISFENPCLNIEDRINGQNFTNQRTFTKPFKLCFVGRLDKEKGIYSVIDAIKNHPNKAIFSQLDIVGDGHETKKIKLLLKDMGIPATLHGSLPREDVLSIYMQSDFLLLPSESEGFPKVIAEAANFGCIPIVSDVSAIGQYVNADNGFLWDSAVSPFVNYFETLNFDDIESLKQKSVSAYKMTEAFTYDHYIQKLKEHIL